MKQVFSLNGAWRMKRSDEDRWISATVPGSVYADLLDAGLMEDPYWRDNELAAFELMKHDYVYEREFDVDGSLLEKRHVLLTCKGLDTVASVSVNGVGVLNADNMHRTWEVPVRGILEPGRNRISVTFTSPVNEIRERFRKTPAEGSTDCTRGFPLLRKAHCMFGWDWGPRLPDAGIWRDIELTAYDEGRICSVLVRQKHEDGAVCLSAVPQVETDEGARLSLRYELSSPSGKKYAFDGSECRIDDPQLWWPNGLGEQPLYTFTAYLTDESGRAVDVWERRIGLRTLTVRREKDEAGESFEFNANGVSFFAMGSDYIPEDNILRRVTPERTRRLIADAKAGNQNSIRVWGGGYYPSDEFYDACDEAGLVVWQDFMFACAMYELTDEFEENILREARDNIVRLRHHASLGLWCGNNEMEAGVLDKWYDYTPSQYSAYIKMYEYILPKAVKELDPDRFYWPASPSSGGGFDEPQDPARGDVHYWTVWHGGVPFTAYRKYLFRFVSEFGFQSFPCLKTVESFTLPEDRNVFSYVMEKHQRNDAANGKIMNYLAATFRYPTSFDTLLYASQLLQAEAIRYGVEHWRRNRGVCMGAVYWQLNDCWPVASWSSIDYFGRWKALHYVSRRFFAPVLLSCEEEGTLTQRTNVNSEMSDGEVEKSIRLNVSNETRSDGTFGVEWALRHADGSVVREGKSRVEVPALSSVWLDKQVFADADLYGDYASFALTKDGREVSRGTALFCAPKHFRFEDPCLTVSVRGDEITVSAERYARSVEVLCLDGDVLFSDNYFDLNADSVTVHVIRGSGTRFAARSVYDIR